MIYHFLDALKDHKLFIVCVYVITRVQRGAILKVKAFGNVDIISFD